jgi:hypothetical protein
MGAQKNKSERRSMKKRPGHARLFSSTDCIPAPAKSSVTLGNKFTSNFEISLRALVIIGSDFNQQLH